MICPAVDLDLSHPPLSRGSALLIAIRVSELAFVWVLSNGGTNGASVPSGPITAEQQSTQQDRQNPREDEPMVMQNLLPDAANILANCFLGCFVMVVAMRVLAYRSPPTVPSRIAGWWPAEWLAGTGRLMLLVVAMVCVLVATSVWLSAVLATMSETAAAPPYVPPLQSGFVLLCQAFLQKGKASAPPIHRIMSACRLRCLLLAGRYC